MKRTGLEYYILDDKNKVVQVKNVLEWGTWLQNFPKKKIVKQQTLKNGKWVSTVFLGLDYNFNLSKQPLLFETMVFPRKGNYGELDGRRYTTWKQALEGHKKLVRKWSRIIKERP